MRIFNTITCAWCGISMSVSNSQNHFRRCSEAPDIPIGSRCCSLCQGIKSELEFSPTSKSCRKCAAERSAKIVRDYGTLKSGRPRLSRGRRERFRPCKYCGESFSASGMYLHTPHCPNRPIPFRGTRFVECLSCGINISARQFQRHLQYDCPNRPDLSVDQRICTICQKTKSRCEFYDAKGSMFECKDCIKSRSQERHARPEVHDNKKYVIAKRMYGLAPEQYKAMEESQKGLCAICGLPPSGKHANTDGLVVDHCHSTGNPRSLLCSRCNHGIGNFRDDPALLMQAIEYLRRHQTASGVA